MFQTAEDRDKYLSIAPSLELKLIILVITGLVTLAINRTIFGIETRLCGLVRGTFNAINRTIFGIETPDRYRISKVVLILSIAPSLELKRKISGLIREKTAAINRTIFGIETGNHGVFIDFVNRYQSHHLWN